MKYSVRFPTRSAEKKFFKILGTCPKEIRANIRSKTLTLGNDPRPYGEPKIKPPLEVYNYTAQYRLRIGDYRVLYDVDDRTKTVWILALRKRNERAY